MIASLSACDGLFVGDRELPDQQIYFQYEYVNYAWGYSHHGWLMDSTGAVWCYDQPAQWNFPDSSGKLPELSMMENLAEADSLCYQIPVYNLAQKIPLIEAAADGTISEPENVMADAGISGYYAWIYDKEHQRYRRILLKEEGDWERENLSEEAETLYKWLEGIDGPQLF